MCVAVASRYGLGWQRRPLVSYRDIRHEKQLHAKLQHTALHDPLTGLANRVLFLDRLTQTSRGSQAGPKLRSGLPRSRPLQAN